MTTTPTPETGKAVRNPDPYNTKVPEIGKPNLGTPVLGPLGVTPQFEPKNETWPWDYGS